MLTYAICLLAMAQGGVTMPAMFSDNMVLQRDAAVPIWGTAQAGETVIVELAGQKAAAIAGNDGKWMVRLKPMRAGGPYTMKVSADTTKTIKNVLVGEVWIASGQSNMEFWLVGSVNGEAEVADSTDPMLRMFTVYRLSTDKPATDVGGAWDVSGPAKSRSFSAVGYFFARELRRRLNVPVGVIHTSWGGTPAEAWTNRDVLRADPDLRVIVERFEKNHPEATTTPAPGNSQAPGGLYNGMIAPLIPYGIRGAIWYQGEGNADRSYQYRHLFPTMIRNWRTAWGQGDFPFNFVQLANFTGLATSPVEDGWAELREAQTMTLSLKNTGMAVTIDIGDAADIHPKNKQDVGLRLALNALSKTYRKKVEYAGPTYKGVSFAGSEAKVTFTHAKGLTAKGGKVVGFALAGEDRKFFWAEGRIEGSTVVLTCSQVAKPVAVRYGWSANPPVSLYNAAGLPASPFRTDQWKGVTADAK